MFMDQGRILRLKLRACMWQDQGLSYLEPDTSH